MAERTKLQASSYKPQAARQSFRGQRRSRAIANLCTEGAVLLLLLAAPAVAHERSTSYSHWDIHGRTARVTLRMLDLEVTHLPWAVEAGRDRDRRLGEYFTGALQLLADDQPCPVVGQPQRLEAGLGRLAMEWQVACPPQGSLRLRSHVLLDAAPSHLHFARVTQDGVQGPERLFSYRERDWDLDEGGDGVATDLSGTSLAGYVFLGIEHILTGYDHLAFVLALLLLGGSIVEIAKVVTGFTVAHSITLGLAVLGYVRPESAPVEALIGLSIALVATENVWLLGPRSLSLPMAVAGLLGAAALAAQLGYGSVPSITMAGLALFSICYFGLLRHLPLARSLRWSIAFLFGLIHGFGFAGVLQEAHLPAERMAAALFGFNVGVELGQLAVVAATWPLLHWATRGRERVYHTVVEVGSAAIAGLGIFWFVARAYG